MERDDLVANEILPALQRGWDSDISRATVHDVLLVPGGVARFEASFLDLEPLCIGRVILVTRSITARRHICHEGTSIVWPVGAVAI